MQNAAVNLYKCAQDVRVVIKLYINPDDCKVVGVFLCLKGINVVVDAIKKLSAWVVASTIQTKSAYAASGATATISILTFNQIVGAVGVMFSVLIAAFTAWSNHKKNQKEIQLIDIRLGVDLMKRHMDDADG